MTRREFTASCLAAAAGLAGTSLAGAGLLPGAAVAGENTAPARGAATAESGETRKPRIAFLLFEGMTALDLIGPAALLANARFSVDYVWRDMNPVYAETTSDKRLGLVPTATFADVDEADVLCVPGTSNPYAQLAREDMLDWVARVGRKATWVTSVCTGSFILGAAGLLRGYKATTHWTVLDQLAYFGAEPVQERVVRDRNRVTGAGVTSGIDFGLTLLALLCGEAFARTQQLMLEYDPAPPFDSGSPTSADPKLADEAKKRYLDDLQRREPGAQKRLEETAKRLGVTAGQ